VISVKVLHLCDSLNPAGLGGYESYLHYLSAELARRGHVSHLATQTPTRDSSPQLEETSYALSYLPGNYLEARKWEFLALPEKEREAQIPVLFKTGDLEENVDTLTGQLTSLIDEVEPDIIHAHSTYVVFNRVLQSLEDNGGIPDETRTILTVHGLEKPLILPSGEATTDYEQLGKYCPFQRILGASNTISTALRTLLAANGQAVEVKTLYLGIDLTVFRPMPQIEKSWDLAFLGRLEHMKAVDLFSPLLAALRDRGVAARMVITGEGSLRDELLSEIRASGVAHLVDVLGVVPWEEVPRIINRSRVVVYPSRKEPFGLSIIEAMACQVPVVTTNAYGPDEIVTDGLDGRKVPPDDLGALAGAVEGLLRDSALRERLGRRARETVEKRFDIRAHTEALLKEYRSLVY
jgi:glycosyltransferase involved in cell wall biosynthesis